MSKIRRLAFAAGSPGIVSVEQAATGTLLYFYLPPPDRGFDAQLPEGTFLGFLTAWGLAVLLARSVDSLAAPVIGHASDRSRSRWGRRRSFMLYGFVPMLALPLLLYWPPAAPGSPINVLWLTGLLCLYHVFATLYMGPYAAMVPEIARSDEERVSLSRLMALASFPMAGAMLAWPRALDWAKAAGLEPTESIRLVVVAMVGAALVLCAIPFFALDERRLESTTPADLSLGEALRVTLRNRPFAIFVSAHILFSLAASLIFPTLPYFATVLLGRSEGFAFDLGAALGGMMGIGFVVIPRLSQSLGPRRVMVASFAIFALAAASLGLIRPDQPQGPEDWRNLLLAFTAMGAMGLPLASSSLLHNVLMGQVIDLDARSSGSNRSAIFLGLLRALDKWMVGLAAVIIGYLFARFGNGPAEPAGVLLIGPIGGCFALVASIVLSRFPELGARKSGSP